MGIPVDEATFSSHLGWDKKTLQRKLDDNKTTVKAVFGKEEKYGRALVTLETSEGNSINDMVSAYVKKLENKSESSTSTLNSDTPKPQAELTN